MDRRLSCRVHHQLAEYREYGHSSLPRRILAPDFLLAQPQITKPKSLLKSFEDAITPATWLAEVQKLLPQVDSLAPVIPAPPVVGAAVGEYVQALSHFRSVIGSPPGLNAVLQNDWTAALTLSDFERDNLTQAARRRHCFRQCLRLSEPIRPEWPSAGGPFYKRDYDAAMFLFGPAGNLPGQIADPPLAPWSFQAPPATGFNARLQPWNSDVAAVWAACDLTPQVPRNSPWQVSLRTSARWREASSPILRKHRSSC